MKYQMAAYCRLSKEDGEKKNSESIENQIKLIEEYIRKSQDLTLADIYIDDGYSGLYFSNRPGFQKMMEDIRKGKIQGVITKDLSRLGREHIETSNYMERIFPSLGIRYIAILDGVDSISQDHEELAQFKTLFNDMYCRDISKKIRGALSAQKKCGRFMSGFAPYGYIKDPEEKHRFLVDEEAAQTVQRIFYMYLEGYSCNNIAKKLNQEGILTPSEYKRKVQKLKYVNGQERGGEKRWAYPTVNMILKNRVYTGAMIQHKTEKISYKIKKCRYIPKEQQYLVEGMHEAIITTEVFEQVQQILKKKIRTKKRNPYAGILICADCGCCFQWVSSKDGYECGTYHRRGNTICSSHFIKKEFLDRLIKREVERQVELMQIDKENLLKEEHPHKNKEQQIRRFRKELELVQDYQKKTYENYVKGLLDQEEYSIYKTEYESKEQELQSRIAKEEQIKPGKKEENEIEYLIKHGTLKEVTGKWNMEFIESIRIYKNKRIDLIFQYKLP